MRLTVDVNGQGKLKESPPISRMCVTKRKDDVQTYCDLIKSPLNYRPGTYFNRSVSIFEIVQGPLGPYTDSKLACEFSSH